MFIQVVCQNPVHSGRTRAKRRFTNGERYRLEVIDREEDFFTDETKQFGDMSRINVAGRNAIAADPVFSVLEDGAVGDSVSSSLIETLKSQLATAHSDLSNQRVENERLLAQLKDVKAKQEAAEFRVAELEDEAKGKGAQPPPPAAESKPEKSSKQK